MMSTVLLCFQGFFCGLAEIFAAGGRLAINLPAGWLSRRLKYLRGSVEMFSVSRNVGRGAGGSVEVANVITSLVDKR